MINYETIKLVAHLEDEYIDRQARTYEIMARLLEDRTTFSGRVKVYETQKGHLAFHRDSQGFVPEWILHTYASLEDAAGHRNSHGYPVYDVEIIEEVAMKLDLMTPKPGPIRLDL